MINSTMSDIDAMSESELKEYIAMATVMQHKFDKLQHSAKILLNSLYGALGTPYFRFFNIWCAEAITLTGQSCTAQSYAVFNEFQQGILGDNVDRVIAGDTDSAYIDLTELILKLTGSTDLDLVIDKVAKLCDVVLAEKLEDKFEQFAVNINAMKNTIDMKREVIGEAVFVAKKNNVIRVYDNEGLRYATPKMKITGLEAIRSATPKFFQKKLIEGYGLIFKNDEAAVHRFVDDTYAESMKLSPNDIAGISTANNIENFIDGDTYKKGTPKHIKGVIAFNKLIEGNDNYQPILSGEKVSIIQMKEPNPIRSPVLAYNTKFPHDLIDEKYIDRDLDYNKYFIKPYTRVLDIVNWTPTHIQTLDDLFF